MPQSPTVTHGFSNNNHGEERIIEEKRTRTVSGTIIKG